MTKFFGFLLFGATIFASFSLSKATTTNYDNLIELLADFENEHGYPAVPVRRLACKRSNYYDNSITSDAYMPPMAQVQNNDTERISECFDSTSNFDVQALHIEVRTMKTVLSC
jgi:hypothetical protein